VHICMYLTVFRGHIHSHMHQFCGFYCAKSAARSSAPHENYRVNSHTSPLPPQRPGRRGRLLPLPARPAPAPLPPRAPPRRARGGSGVEAPVPPGAVWGWGRRSCRRRSPSAAGGGAGGGGQLLGRGRRQRRRRKWNRPPA
jgi:hypothetical protein